MNMRIRTTVLLARFPALAAILTAAFVFSSCSSKKSPPPPPPPPPVTVASVNVSAQTNEFVTATEVANGATVQFKAQTSMSNSTSNDVTATATWASGDSSILAFETTSVPGLATSKKQGAVTITATESGGTAGTLSYTVAAPAPTGLAVDPPQVPNGIPVGQEGNFKAIYTLTDKTTSNVTANVDWSSSTGGVVVIGNEAGNKGKAVALAAGTSNISASKGTLSSQPVAVTVFVPVGPPQFVVDPAAPKQLPLGRTQQFRALLTYADDKVVDVTERVTWQSSAENLAQFPTDFPKGLLLASPTQTGAVTITAQDPASAGQTSPVTINVSSVAINSVVISPVGTADKPLPVGAGRQLGVIATYADNVARDITQTVDWSTTGTYLSVTNNTGSKGLVKSNLERPSGEAVGTVVITDPITTQSVNVAIDTVGRALDRIEIAPADKKLLPQGYTQQFKASAIYSDTSVDPATDQVVWQSSAGDKVAISNTGNDKGKATALKEGSSNVSAAVTVDGKKFVSNTVVVEVTPAALQTIAIMPTAAVELSVGGTKRLTAVGTFSDASTRDVTGLVNWRSTDAGVVSVVSSGSAAGTVKGEAVGGPTTVVATEPRTGVPGSKLISVTAKAENSISITPAGVTSRPVGTEFRYEAILTFTDASFDNVSEAVQWQSSDPAIAMVSNEPGSKGKMFGRTVGSVTVTASGGGLTSAPVTFTVLSGVLQSIVIAPSTPQSKNIGETAQFTAQGSYSDGSSQDITKTVVWNSDSPGVAIITSTAPNEGALAATGAGLATITAGKDGVTSPGTSVVVAPPTAITTVAQINGGCCSGQQVIMQGRATEQIDGDDYTFEDSTGSIRMEWEGTPPITVGVEVYITGLPESSGNEVDVSKWTPVSP